MIESSEGVVNAEVFNNSLVNIHGKAIDYLKLLGFNQKAIDDSLKAVKS